MKRVIAISIAAFSLVSALSAQALDMGAVVKAQVILGQVSQVVDKYKEVQDLIDQQVIELDIPEPIDDNSGKFLFPYTYDGELTAWGDKALTAQVGAEAGAMAADKGINTLAAKVPFGGLLGGAMKSKAKETGAIMAIGGWDFIRENSELSFNKLSDLSVYMHAEFFGDPDYETALAAATAIYPKLESGHKRAIDRAYKRAKKDARKLLKDEKALAAAVAAAAAKNTTTEENLETAISVGNQ